jgi:L-ascorbate metabolism protein UlaG (beta-lactamase superfamily)
MTSAHSPVIRYFGWSALSIETSAGAIFFDPFYRRYCGAQWFGLEDFAHAKLICATHGHEEHYLDIPAVAARSGADVVGTRAVCDYLHWRSRVPRTKLHPADPFTPIDVDGFRITTFKWKHRDINLWKALTKAVFQGNATQLSWAWSSATNAPFYSAYTGFHIELPGGLTVLNYNEGFNTKMTDAEIQELGRRVRTDVLLAGMQLDFTEDVARGAAALDPKVVVLYPPHDHFHRMMGAVSRPWPEFKAAVERRLPKATVVIAEPGHSIDALSGRVLTPARTLLAA